MPEDENAEVTQYQRLCYAAIELLVNVGLMGTIVEHWPLVVQENWEARIEGLIVNMEGATSEIQQFGEAFDED